MKQHYLFSVFALALKNVLAIPPADFGLPSSTTGTPLGVTYQANGSNLMVQPGALFGINVPAEMPQIGVNETAESLIRDYNGSYLLMMVDPDAPSPDNPSSRFIIHWWQEGLTKSTVQVNDTNIGGTYLQNSTAARVDYRRPRPPPDSAAHRYIQYLFQQPSDYQIPDAYSGYNSTNSSKFPFEDFVRDANLLSPVAANYFYCSNQSTVPVDFVAAPGQTYPGGNGAIITQGTSSPVPTVTLNPTSSGSGSSSATASASAAMGNVIATKDLFLSVGLAIWASLMIVW